MFEEMGLFILAGSVIFLIGLLQAVFSPEYLFKIPYRISIESGMRLHRQDKLFDLRPNFKQAIKKDFLLFVVVIFSVPILSLLFKLESLYDTVILFVCVSGLGLIVFLFYSISHYIQMRKCPLYIGCSPGTFRCYWKDGHHAFSIKSFSIYKDSKRRIAYFYVASDPYKDIQFHISGDSKDIEPFLEYFKNHGGTGDWSDDEES